MKNKTNRTIYKLWAPIYDQLFGRGVFARARQQVFQSHHFQENENVLFVGCGTGADFDYIPMKKLHITAIDYSREMLSVAKARRDTKNVAFYEMDAHQLTFPDEAFDTTVANLVLSVVPDGRTALQEAIRVTKRGGTIIIFDKFAPANEELSFSKKVLRPIIAAFGTDIGRSFETLIDGLEDEVTIYEDTPLFWNGMYRKIILKCEK